MGDSLDIDDERWLGQGNSGGVSYEDDSEFEEGPSADIVDDDDNSDKNSEVEEERLREEAKKQKRKQKFAELKAKKRQKSSSSPQDEETAAATSTTSVLPNQLTAEEMLHLIQSHFPLELQDLLLDPFNNPKSYQVSNFFYPALEASAAMESVTKKPCPFVRALSVAMPGYKKILLNTNKVKEDQNGCPILVILCASANRASEIIKSISSKLIKCRIAKLFAKHFKISDQIEMLAKEYYPIAIGTPNRVSKLIELGALSLSRTKIVLLDLTEDIKEGKNSPN
eukprot:gene1708-1867_t